jgi:hypothetical protein
MVNGILGYPGSRLAFPLVRRPIRQAETLPKGPPSGPCSAGNRWPRSLLSGQRSAPSASPPDRIPRPSRRSRNRKCGPAPGTRWSANRDASAAVFGASGGGPGEPSGHPDRGRCRRRGIVPAAVPLGTSVGAAVAVRPSRAPRHMPRQSTECRPEHPGLCWSSLPHRQFRLFTKVLDLPYLRHGLIPGSKS